MNVPGPVFQPFAWLLVHLGRAGIELASHRDDPSRLIYRPARLHPDVLVRIKSHRLAILALLIDKTSPSSDGKGSAFNEHFTDHFTERLAIADDLQIPTHPGSPAWLIAAGEAIELDLKLTLKSPPSWHSNWP